MISLNQVSVQFGSFELLSNISLMFNRGEKVGLVGNNGAGKTTLLRLFVGKIKPGEGKIVISKETTVGYLPQQMKHKDRKTLLDETLTAFSGITRLEGEIENINNVLAQREDYKSDEYKGLIHRLSEAHEEYRIKGGHSIMADAEKALIGLGFTRDEFSKPTSFFSGGWRMRIELAKLLLKKPDFLLLDEPTNHLDIESIQWLENYLKDYHGGVILISHDRAFLDNVTSRTVELSLGKIYDYKVPFSQFVKLRRERMETQLAAYRNQQKKIADTHEFIDRFRYKATKAVQVQSRIKHIDRLERIEVENEDRSGISIKFPPAPRAGSIVVEATSLSKSYGKNLVLDEIDIIIERGEKVAFVGKNGEGKTTFSRILMGELEFSGNLKLGHNVITGYFAQNQDELMDGNKTVFQIIDDVAKGEIRTRIRDILGAFLFSREAVDKKVKVLSGGERSRLALIKLLLEPNNLLIMDEPTNHLDMRSIDILKEALLEYNGTLVIVSHDREFLDGLTNKVFEFSNHKIKENIGGIYDFLRRKKIESLRELEIKRTGLKALQKKETPNKKEYFRRKEYEKNLRKLESRVSKLESEIGILEKEIMEMDRVLASPEKFANYISGKDFFVEYEKLKEKLTLKLKEWEESSADVEKMR
ncbi:MAG: ATP-binding cassette domain-containing protein [Bacteroidetes bacterium]|nr:ATP-binding cassette domain-containing protein [Bacteroidota bacterium]